MYIYLLFMICSSEEWKRVGDKEKKQMGLTFSNDGEFW